MAKDVALSTEAGMPATAEDLRASLSTYKKDAAPAVTEGFNPFLRLLKDGSWVYGQENIDVEEGSRWAVNPLSIKHGFVAWNPDEGVTEKLGEVMVPFTQPTPAQDQLPQVGGPWQAQVAFDLACVSGDDEGVQVYYATTSIGGKRAHRDVVDAIIKQLDEDALKPVPVVELEMDHYQHKKWGRIYTPIFAIKGWAPLQGTEVSESKPAPERKTANKTRSRKAATSKGPEKSDAPRRRRKAA